MCSRCVSFLILEAIEDQGRGSRTGQIWRSRQVPAFSRTMSDDAKMCPWCERWALKDAACNYIFACGLDTKTGFHIGQGCGRSWCWGCGKKFCRIYYDPVTGKKMPGARDNHDSGCCKNEEGYTRETYCMDGCSGHCPVR